jgi:SsrA-binding protein
MGRVSLVDSYCYFVGNELFVKGMNVATYFWGSWGQHEPTRDRKLLLNKKELRHLRQSVKEKGLTIVTVKIFINDEGLAKLVIALAKGKKVYDKRQTIKEKDIRREMERSE